LDAEDGVHLQAIDHGEIVKPERNVKPKVTQIFTKPVGEMSVSYLGDMHPSFAGNVVKAMASGKKAAPLIHEKISKSSTKQCSGEVQNYQDMFLVRVHDMKKIDDNVTEITFHAPAHVKHFEPGHFYRLQNFYKNASLLSKPILTDDPSPLFMAEGVALSGLNVDKDTGILKTLVLNLGASSYILQHLKVGESVSLMGPTGMPAPDLHHKNVLLIGGGFYNPVVAEMHKKFKRNGCKTTYIAAYKNASDVKKVYPTDVIADNMIYTYDAEDIDLSFDKSITCVHGNAIDGLRHCLVSLADDMKDIDYAIIMGTPMMLKAFQAAFQGEFKGVFSQSTMIAANGSTPMQCMMKGICSQCVCDKKNTNSEKFFTCAEQDQPLVLINFETVFQRLTQNATQEKVNKLWVQTHLNN
jgi:NAD(P)H-flavin reductase